MVKSILQSLMLCAIFFTMSTRATEGQWSNWGTYGTCSETCQSNINTVPTQSRTRTCNGGTFGTTCPGSGVDIRDCNVAVACQGSLTQWSAYDACSATCQAGLQAPTRQRRRTCERATFGGNCNDALLIQITDCNVEVACTGQWSNWGAYGTCSATCQSNITVPTQSRRRTCNGGTFGATCLGSSVDIRYCNVRSACPGNLTQWSEYGACSGTCHTDLQPITQQRTRNCVGATFGGNCNDAILVETTNCDVDAPCGGQWFKWGAYDTCSATCQSNINAAPTRSRTRTCNGGRATCSGSSVDTQKCNVRIACQGSPTQWSTYGACSATCHFYITPPTKQRKRTCVGSTFGGNCNGIVLVQNTDCNVEIVCPGNLTQWSDYNACSSTCQSVIYTPTQHRTRTCVGATFGGDCNGASLNETIYCNLNVDCPGILSPWEQWSACSESFQSNLNVTPTKSRARNCSEATFNGNCGGASLTESKTCNAGVDCQDGDQDNNKTIIIVASASIVSTLIIILIIFLIVKFKVYTKS